MVRALKRAPHAVGEINGAVLFFFVGGSGGWSQPNKSGDPFAHTPRGGSPRRRSACAPGRRKAPGRLTPPQLPPRRSWLRLKDPDPPLHTEECWGLKTWPLEGPKSIVWAVSKSVGERETPNFWTLTSPQKAFLWGLSTALFLLSEVERSPKKLPPLCFFFFFLG